MTTTDPTPDPLDTVFVKVAALASWARRATIAAIIAGVAFLVALLIILLLSLALQARNDAVDNMGRVGDCRANAYAATFDDVQELLIVQGDRAEEARQRLIARGSLIEQYEACSAVSICRDGTPSQSSGPGTCSHHGGVDRLTPTTQGD